MAGKGSKPGERRGGRKLGVPNKTTVALRAYAGKYTTEAIKGLVQLGQSAESESARVAAWKEVLDRAVGKAPQALTDPDGGPMSNLVRVIHEHVTAAE